MTMFEIFLCFELALLAVLIGITALSVLTIKDALERGVLMMEVPENEEDH